MSSKARHDLTAKQREAKRLIGGDQMHTLLYGGSRSGKTFLDIEAVVTRAIACPDSRHGVVRFRFNAVKASVVLDTFPKVMKLRFPGVVYKLDKTDWYAKLPNGAEIWFFGLDDKERTEKVLGMEFATLLFIEISQIPRASVVMALSRLAQKVFYTDSAGERRQLRLKALYECNPPSKAHWSHKLFVQKIDPDTGEPVSRPEQYKHMRLNPDDNRENISDEYFEVLDAMPARARLRFRDGEWGSAIAGALFTLEDIEKWRVIDGDNLPDMVRVLVAVDPSGADDVDNADNDEIGILVGGLGTDGNGYVLEDLTVKAGPATWGNVVASAFERHMADAVVAEENFGGAMVKHVIRTANSRIPYRAVRASRGKAVRAEPIGALAEKGKVRNAGRFPQLEDELCSMSTAGYVGSRSPNRADAYVWLFTALFPGIVKEEREKPARRPRPSNSNSGSWMAA